MANIWISRSLLLMVLTGASAHALANPPTGPMFRELGHAVDYFHDAGVGKFATADLDHDGVTDLVFGGIVTNNILFVVGKQTNGALGFKQALVTKDDDSNDSPSGYARVLAWHRAPSTQIVTVNQTGTARIYGGWPLTELSHFAVADNAVAAAIGDVDASGHDDLVVLTHAGLFAYALDGGSQEWTKASSDGSDVALAQLDNDPALEIIVAGPKPGLVLDGATRATDWSYIDGFGAKLATGIFTAGGKTQWVAAANWYLFTMFGAEPWSPLWDYSTGLDIRAVATGDLDGNGIDSILYGDGQWADIHVIDPATHQERFSIPSGGYAVTAIVVGDVNGDSTPDIVFSSTSADAGGAVLTVVDAETGETLWTFSPASGPYRTAAIGDVDGDGRNDVVAATNGNYSYANVSIFDAVSGVREWQSFEPGNNADDPFSMSVNCIKLIPHADRPGMDVVLAGDGSYYGKMVVLDGVSKSITLQIGYSQSPLLLNRTVTGVATTDFDHDGIDDYVLATQSVSNAAGGAKLEVVSGANGELLWESVGMGSGSTPISDVFVVPPQHLGGASELVAVLRESLRAYNSDTRLLDWVLSASNNGAAYIDVGLAAPELMLYQASGAISFYDAATRVSLRSFATPTPLRGVTALQGDARTLLIAANQRLSLVDGSGGNVLATSAFLGQMTDGSSYSTPSATPLGTSSWQITLPTQAALWRMRLDASDRIFQGSFETL